MEITKSGKIELIEREHADTVEIAAVIPTWKMPFVIRNSYKKLIGFMKSKNTEPSGAPFVRYLNINWNEDNKKNKLPLLINMFTKKWNILIGFPINFEIKESGKIKKGFLPGGKYLKTLHPGSYQKVGNAYSKLIAYSKEKNIKLGNQAVEIYLNDPEKTKTEELETIVMIPVKED